MIEASPDDERPAPGDKATAPGGWTRRRIVLAVLAALALWALVAAVLLFKASRDLRDGVSSATRARALLSPADVEKERPIAPLRSARRSFAAAHRILANPVLYPIRVVPIAGRQMRSLLALSGAAERVAAIGSDAAREGHDALAGSHDGGPDRLVVLGKLADLAGRADRALGTVDLGPSRGLVGPLARRRTKLASDLSSARQLLARARAGSAGAADLLDGRHYLLLAANNAEMRSGSGMFLTAGLVTTDQGRLSLADVRQTAELGLPGDGVPISGDLADRWGWLHPNREWRNLGVTPEFDVTAPLATRMLVAKTGEHVDGVLAVDVVALQDILQATGPVQGPSGPLTADNVVQFLLHDQYLVADPLSQTRRDAVGEVAARVLQSVESRQANLVGLAAAVGRAVEGRHLMLWSADPTVQQDWVTSGVAGTVGPDDVMVAILNRGGNKLDQFLPVTSRVEWKASGRDTELTLHVTVRNTTPTGEPQYIAGPDPNAGVTEGVYKGIVAVNLPGRVTQAAIDGTQTYAAIGAEGATNVLALPFELPRGASREFVVRFREPGRHGALRILPSARFPAMAWDAGGSRFSGGGPRIVRW